jgi:hypothetical protein
VRGWFRRRPQQPAVPPNPATLISATDIAVKTAHGLSTPEWLALTPDEQRDARLGVVAALNERNAA